MVREKANAKNTKSNGNASAAGSIKSFFTKKICTNETISQILLPVNVTSPSEGEKIQNVPVATFDLSSKKL